MQQVTEFQLLQLKSTLESSLETNGSQHKESLKLLLQYSQVLGKFAEQKQDNQLRISYYGQAFQLLQPTDAPKLLTIQFQYWRLLVRTTVRYSLALQRAERLQQGLNVLIQVENLIEKSKAAQEVGTPIDLEYLYFHLALLWLKVGNKEQAQTAANESIRLLKGIIKYNIDGKLIQMVQMLIEMYLVLIQVRHHDPTYQLNYYRQIYELCVKHYGAEDQETCKYLMKINKVKAEMQFESELEAVSKKEFKESFIRKQPNGVFGSVIDFYEQESIIEQQLLKPQKQSKRSNTSTDQQLNIIKQQLKQSHIRTKSKQSGQYGNVAQRLLTPTPIVQGQRMKTTTDEVRSDMNRSKLISNMYFFANGTTLPHKLNTRTKTETTNYKSVVELPVHKSGQISSGAGRISPGAGRITPVGAGRVSPAGTNTKTSVSIQESFGNLLSKQNYSGLLLARPQSSACFKRIEKQLETNRSTHTSKVQPSKPVVEKFSLLRKTVKDKIMRNKMRGSRNDFPLINTILPPELSSNNRSVQDINQSYFEQSQLQQLHITINNDYDKQIHAIMTIQRFYRNKLKQILDRRNEQYNPNNPNNLNNMNDNPLSSNSIISSYNGGQSQMDQSPPAMRKLLYQRSTTAYGDQLDQEDNNTGPIRNYESSTQIKRQFHRRAISKAHPLQCSLKLTLPQNPLEEEESHDSIVEHSYGHSIDNRDFPSLEFPCLILILSHELEQNITQIRRIDYSVVQVNEEYNEVIEIMLQNKIGHCTLKLKWQSNKQSYIARRQLDHIEYISQSLQSFIDSQSISRNMLQSYVSQHTGSDNLLDDMFVEKLSLLLIHTMVLRKQNGKALFVSMDKQIKQNRYQLDQFIKERVLANRKYYLQMQPIQLRFQVEHVVTPSEVTESTPVSESIKSRIKQKLGRVKNVISFALQAKRLMQSHEPQLPPSIPLAQVQDMPSEKQIHLSHQDPDQNRIKLKSIINPVSKKRMSTNLDVDMSSLLKQKANLRRSSCRHDAVAHIETPQSKGSLFKKTQTIEQPHIFSFGEQPKIQRQNVVFMPPFQHEDISLPSSQQEDSISSNEQIKKVLIQNSAKLYRQPTNAALHKQTSIVEQPHHDIDYQVSIPIPIATLYQGDKYLNVSPQWKQKRSMKTFDDKLEYFDTAPPEKRKIVQCFLNTFYTREVLFRTLIRKDGILHFVQVILVLDKPPTQFNQQYVDQRDSLHFEVVYGSIVVGNGWTDTIKFKFREFIKWYVVGFELTSFLRHHGFNDGQKLSIIHGLNQYLSVVDCRLKVEYYQTKYSLKQRSTKGRLQIEVERALMIEQYCGRDKLDSSVFITEGVLGAHKQILEWRAKQQKELERHEKRKSVQNIVHQLQIIDNEDEGVMRTLVVFQQELNSNLLHDYNTVRYLKDRKHHLKISEQYLIWDNKLVKIWSPFNRKCWIIIRLKCIDKLVNALQSSMKYHIMKSSLQSHITRIGKQSTIHKVNTSYSEHDLITLQLFRVIQQKSTTLNDQYLFLHNLKVSLLSQNHKFWMTYFVRYVRLMHGTVRGLGECTLYVELFIDDFKVKINPSLIRYFFVKVSIQQMRKLRTSEYKVVMTLTDLEYLYGKQFNERVFLQFDQDRIFSEIQKVMVNNIAFNKVGVCRTANLIINNIKINQQITLAQRSPWVQKCNYNDIEFTPYDTSVKFFNLKSKDPTILCQSIKFVQLPTKVQFLSKGQYHTYETKNDKPKQSVIYYRTPCIFTVMRQKQLQSFFIKLYFPSTSRKFITQVHYQEIVFKDKSSALNRQQRLMQYVQKNNTRLWLPLIAQFRVQINHQRKLLLVIEDFSVSCVLQELLYFRVHRLPKNTHVLIMIHIETKKEEDPEYLSLHRQFPRIRVMDAVHFCMFAKLQWMDELDKMQSSRLPMQELMVGYHKSTLHLPNIFDYRFKQVDFIALCRTAIENIVLSWATPSDGNSIQQLMPEEGARVNKAMKINSGVQGRINLQNRLYIMIYRGVLLNTPQTIVGIYYRATKQNLYFYVQRLTDGRSFVHKLNYQEVENQIPGFIVLLRTSNTKSVGQKVFRVYKNTMIIQSYYQLSN